MLGMLAGSAAFAPVRAQAVYYQKFKHAAPGNEKTSKTGQVKARIIPDFQERFNRSKQKPNLLIDARKSAVQDCGVTSCVLRGPTAPLPVTLIEFSGRRTDAFQVQLFWKTSSEVNNDYFEVERTLNPAGEFTVAGKVTGRGNSSQNVSYQFTDPNQESEYTYYRLKQVDRDGSFTYSRIIAVKGYQETLAVAAFPNPALAKDVKFQVAGSKRETTLGVFVYDLKGKLIYKNAQYPLTESKQILLPELGATSGSYVIKIRTSQQEASASFVILQ